MFKNIEINWNKFPWGNLIFGLFVLIAGNFLIFEVSNELIPYLGFFTVPFIFLLLGSSIYFGTKYKKFDEVMSKITQFSIPIGCFIIAIVIFISR